jgi:hypothetical protein
MDATVAWAAISAVAAAVTAIITLYIARANFAVARTTANASDFLNCLDVVARLGDAQRRVRDASDQTVQEFEFRELLNLMEALALLENDNRIAPSTRRFTEHFLVESYAFMRSQMALRPLLEKSVTGEETFSELEKFAERRWAKIEHLSDVYQSRNAKRE